MRPVEDQVSISNLITILFFAQSQVFSLVNLCNSRSILSIMKLDPQKTFLTPNFMFTQHLLKINALKIVKEINILKCFYSFVFNWTINVRGKANRLTLQPPWTFSGVLFMPNY